MSLRPIGGIYARLNSSSNLTFYDASGNVLATFISGALSVATNYATVVNAGGQHTTSTTSVSTGIGVSLTLQVSTAVSVGYNVAAYSDTNADGWYAQLYYNTTGIPSNGSAITGSSPGHTTIGMSSIPVGSTVVSLAGFDKITGLTAGTTYYFYIAFRAVTGGTVTTGLVELTASEG
jgi:hypothetical protein